MHNNYSLDNIPPTLEGIQLSIVGYVKHYHNPLKFENKNI